MSAVTMPCTVPECGAAERKQLSPSDGWVRAEINGFMQPRWFHNAACAATALKAAEKGLYFTARASLSAGCHSWMLEVIDPASDDILAREDFDYASPTFPAASAGHRLVELGFIVISAERARPETLFGWTETDKRYDVWTTVCTRTD